MSWPSAFRSTRALAAITILCVVLVSLAPLLVLWPSALESEREGVVARDLSTLAALLATEASPALSTADRSSEGTVLARAVEATGVSAVLWDDHSTVVASAGPEAFGMAVRPGAEVAQALAGSRGQEVRALASGGGDAVFVAVPVRAGARVLGAVQLAEPLAAIPGPTADWRGTLLAWLAAIGLFALALALWLSDRLSRPLRLLGEAADAVASGRYDTVMATRGVREVDDLGLAFARMAKALQGSFAIVEAERDRLDAVLRHMADGILIANAEGAVSLANPAARRILGVDARAAMGRRLAAVVREHELVEVFHQCLADEHSGRDHVAVVERASPRRYLRAVATRVGEGQSTQVLLVLQDLTETRRLETVRRDFFANVSHELRTPIAAIKAMVETLEDGALDDPPAARDFVARVHRETDGLSQLVEELLQLSRIESGQAVLRVEAVNPGDLIYRTMERLAPLAERAGVGLEAPELEGLPLVRADRERIGQVLTNIVHNAIKFTPPGGQVTITARARDRDVAFAVADTGIGIAEEDLPRLFERFYKADRARSRGAGGTGLGLAIAKHLVQAHGGAIWAESAGPGRGAVFTFTLPLA